MSRIVLGGIGNDVVLDRELLERKRGTLDVASHELLTLLCDSAWEKLKEWDKFRGFK
jgi:hypothetical protein